MGSEDIILDTLARLWPWRRAKKELKSVRLLRRWLGDILVLFACAWRRIVVR